MDLWLIPFHLWTVSLFSQVDCKNYIRLLQFLPDGRVYVCGTYAFDPQCAFLVRAASSSQ